MYSLREIKQRLCNTTTTSENASLIAALLAHYEFNEGHDKKLLCKYSLVRGNPFYVATQVYLKGNEMALSIRDDITVSELVRMLKRFYDHVGQIFNGVTLMFDVYQHITINTDMTYAKVKTEIAGTNYCIHNSFSDSLQRSDWYKAVGDCVLMSYKINGGTEFKTHEILKYINSMLTQNN